VRSDSLARLQAYEVALRDAMSTLLDTMDLRHEVTRLAATEPAACAPHVQEAIRNAARELGYTSLSLPSGAGHDAAFVRYCGPMGMVFIPCAQGRSHCPEEAITQQQALDGTRVLREALLRLDAAGVGA
jgi:N-carbamoyl-L-amino-acid hydrolase